MDSDGKAAPEPMDPFIASVWAEVYDALGEAAEDIPGYPLPKKGKRGGATGAPGRKGRPFVRISGRELYEGADPQADLDPLPFLGREDLIFRGMSHLFAAFPRVGKTEVLTWVMRDWLRAGESVLYVSEEREANWRKRLKNYPADPEVWGRLAYVYGVDLDLDEALAEAINGPEQIVFLDTMREILRPDDETNNSQMRALLQPWIAGVCGVGKTLIVVSHENKVGGAGGRGIAGGHAIMGMFDVPLILREDPMSANQRILDARGARLVSPQPLVYLRSDEGEFLPRGTVAQVRAEAKAEALQDLLIPLLTAEPQSVNRYKEQLPPPQPQASAVRAALELLAAAGIAARVTGNSGLVRFGLAERTPCWCGQPGTVRAPSGWICTEHAEAAQRPARAAERPEL